MDFSNLIDNSNMITNSYSLFNINKILNNSNQSSYIDNTNRLIERESSSASSSIGDINFLTQSKQALNQSWSCDRKKLFVGNLPSNTTLNELIELFSKFGPVNEELSVVKDDNYAFIHFFSELDAEMAYKELNDSFFKNRYIRVQYSTSRGHIKKTRNIDISKSASFINAPMYNKPKLQDLQFKSKLLKSPIESLIKSKLQENRMTRSACSSQSIPFSASYLTNSQSVMSFDKLSKNNTIGSGRPIKGASSKHIADSMDNIYNNNQFDQPSMPLSQSFQQLSYNLLLNNNDNNNNNNNNNQLLWNSNQSISTNPNSLLIPANSTLNIQNQIDLLNLFYQRQQMQQRHQLAEIERLKFQLQFEKLIPN